MPGGPDKRKVREGSAFVGEAHVETDAQTVVIHRGRSLFASQCISRTLELLLAGDGKRSAGRIWKSKQLVL